MGEVTPLRRVADPEVFSSPHRAALFRSAVEKGDKFAQVRILNDEIGERLRDLAVDAL